MRAFLYRVFPPKEVRECLTALKTLDALFGDVLFWSHVRARVQFLIRDYECRAAMLRSLNETKLTHRILVLHLIGRVSFDWLSSGQYHVYRGVLGIEGRDFRLICDMVTKEMEQLGYLSSEEAKGHLLNVVHAIQDVG